jgi:hypothetical protein
MYWEFRLGYGVEGEAKDLSRREPESPLPFMNTQRLRYWILASALWLRGTGSGVHLQTLEHPCQ